MLKLMNIEVDIVEFELLDKINYSQLKGVIDKFNSDPDFKWENGDPLYLETIKKRNVWENLDKISLDDTKDVVLDFLNKWKCRIGYECVPKLQEALIKTHNLFELLKDEKLEDTDFEKTVTGAKIKDLIKQIFDILSRVRAGRRTIGFTGTTKIMHMVIPELFIMCDEEIRKAHGCEGNSEGYLNFLCRMQKDAQRFIKEKNKTEICQELHSGDRTFTKILDEYNYYTITFQKRN